MDNDSPVEPPEGDWWNREVNRRETIWLGVTGTWAVLLFGWMVGWTQWGDQNQIGETLRVTPSAFRDKVSTYKENAGMLEVGGEEMVVPAEDDVYVGALQWSWDGLPAVIKPGKTYRFHLGSYDVQHGFSVRNEDNLSQQISLQVLPDYEWIVEMSFDDPGTYQVICNEFCGTGHRSMHGKFLVRDYDESAVVPSGADTGGDVPADFDGWFTDRANGGTTENYEGPVDRTGTDSVTVSVGAEGNGGTFAFDPPAVRVSPGTTITFEWVSDNHNVLVERQPGGAGWNGHESLENTGFTVQHTFEDAGVYKYYCQPHLALGMKGVVEVA